MTIIEKLDGTRFHLPSIAGVKTAELKVSPIDNIYDSENIKNAPGRNRTTRYHGVRKLQIKTLLQAYDIMQTGEIRDELAQLFDGEEDFYVYESLMSGGYAFEMPGESSFETATDRVEYTDLLHKRWLVERINNDGIEWKGLTGKRVLELETSQLPYAETPFTVQQLGTKEWDVDKWAWGLGIEWDKNLTKYLFYSNTFNIFNYGDVTIDPTRRFPLRIELRGLFGSQVEIINLSTGDVFLYNGRLSSSDVLVLDGIQMTKNGVSIVGQTNKRCISLKSGENRFSINGGVVSSCSFDHRFYFK